MHLCLNAHRAYRLVLRWRYSASGSAGAILLLLALFAAFIGPTQRGANED
jgi:hypothetical protein